MSSEESADIKRECLDTNIYLMHIFISIQIMTHSIIGPFMNDGSNLKQKIQNKFNSNENEKYKLMN